MNYCEKNQIPYAVILGEEEINRGYVKLKNVQNRDDKGTEIPRDKIVEELKKLLKPSSG